jgi:hypothetical protein
MMTSFWSSVPAARIAGIHKGIIIHVHSVFHILLDTCILVVVNICTAADGDARDYAAANAMPDLLRMDPTQRIQAPALANPQSMQVCALHVSSLDERGQVTRSLPLERRALC